MCEELFGGGLDVVEVPDDCEKSQARQHRNWLHQRKRLLQSAKGDGHLKEDGGLLSVLRKMQLLKESMKRNDCYIEHFVCHLKDKMVQKIKEVRSPKKVVLDGGTHTLPKLASRSTPDPCKWLRELTVSPEERAAKKPVEKRPGTSSNQSSRLRFLLGGTFGRRSNQSGQKGPALKRLS